MVRKAIQLLVLPLLFALLAAGGNATLCEVLSIVGLEVHHHAGHGDDDRDHAGSFCLETHEGHYHEHDQVPCPPSCGIQLPEAPAPALLKVPAVSGALVNLFLSEVLLSANLPETVFQAVGMLEPPDYGATLTDPAFTGRFLV